MHRFLHLHKWLCGAGLWELWCYLVSWVLMCDSNQDASRKHAVKRFAATFTLMINLIPVKANNSCACPLRATEPHNILRWRGPTRSSSWLETRGRCLRALSKPFLNSGRLNAVTAPRAAWPSAQAPVGAEPFPKTRPDPPVPAPSCSLSSWDHCSSAFCVCVYNTRAWSPGCH